MLIAAVEERYKDAGELTKIIKQSRIAGMSRGMMSSTAVVKGCGFILIDPSNTLTTDLFPGAIFFSSSVPRPAFHVAVKEKERNLAGARNVKSRPSNAPCCTALCEIGRAHV